jgi:hypothetical protein
MLHYFSQWLQYNYVPRGRPFYEGADWPNAFILLVLVPAGFLWSKTRFWPLNLLHAKLDQALAHHQHAMLLLEEVHHRIHTGEDHPRVAARREAGQRPTPRRPV